MAGPLGSFYLKDETASVLIAGGIGITPCRSIIKQIEAEGKSINQPIHLIYLDSSKVYIFQDELNQISENTAVKIT